MPDVCVGAETSEESLDARASGAFSSPVGPTALPRSTAGASSSRIGGSSSSPRCARRCMRRSVMPAARNARRFPGGGRVHPRSSKSNAISSRSLSDPFCRFSSAALGSVALGSRATAAAAPCDGRAEGARPAGTPRAARVVRARACRALMTRRADWNAVFSSVATFSSQGTGKHSGEQRQPSRRRDEHRPERAPPKHTRARGDMPRAMATGRSAARLVATCLLLATCVGTAEVRLPSVSRAVPGASRFPIRARRR